MTVEFGGDVSGFGYSQSDKTSSSNGSAEGAEYSADKTTSASGSDGVDGEAHASAEQPAGGSEESIDRERLDEMLPGYEASAAACFNRARLIQQSLNHLSLTADHLMLALTLDQGARRQLERVGDITKLREAAMRRLGHQGSARTVEEQSLAPTADLADIAKAAREAAGEREQAVSISDLVNAFPKQDGRLIYGSSNETKAVALLDRIEHVLVPQVADSIAKIESVAVDAIQQTQTVQKMLQDMNARRSYNSEQREATFMAQIRDQVRNAVDTQLGDALRTITAKVEDAIDALKAEKIAADKTETVSPLVTQSDLDPAEPDAAPPRREPEPERKSSGWGGWLPLL